MDLMLVGFLTLVGVMFYLFGSLFENKFFMSLAGLFFIFLGFQVFYGVSIQQLASQTIDMTNSTGWHVIYSYNSLALTDQAAQGLGLIFCLVGLYTFLTLAISLWKGRGG